MTDIKARAAGVGGEVLCYVAQEKKIMSRIAKNSINISDSVTCKFENGNFFKIYIDYDRKELIERINLRTHDMIETGAINEVNKFIKLKINKDKTATKAIGVNEIKAYLANEKKLKIDHVGMWLGKLLLL